MPRFLLTAVLATVLAATSWAADLSIILGGGDITDGDKAGKAGPGSADCVAYWIFIRTGDVANGGTDGSVHIALHGDLGTTGLFSLSRPDSGWQTTEGGDGDGTCRNFAQVISDNANPSDNFEAGSYETYTVLAPDIGNVSAITVRMDADGTAGSGWYLQRIDVEKGVRLADGWRRSRNAFHAIFNNWLESGVPQSRTEGAAYDASYEIVFQTGTDSGAGTDSDITIRLDGKDSSGKPVRIETVINPFISGNAFENGARDTAILEDRPAMERLSSVTVTTADNYAGSAWQLSRIEVSSPSLCGGAPRVACEYLKPEILSFGNVWLGGDRLSATAAAASGARNKTYDGPSDEPAPRLCARLLQATNVDRGAAARLCARSTDAYRDAACLIVASVYALPVDEWADKCIDDPDGAAAELDRISSGAPQTPPPAPTPEAAPGPTEAPPPNAGESEEARCMRSVDGRVAWSRNGDNRWQPENIAALCAGTTNADARIACFEGRIAAGEPWDTAIPACAASADGAPSQAMPAAGSSAEAQRCKALLQDQVPWRTNPPERHWEQADLDALCDGSTDAVATVRCFQSALWNNGNETDLQTAIEACRAR